MKKICPEGPEKSRLIPVNVLLSLIDVVPELMHLKNDWFAKYKTRDWSSMKA